MAKGNRKKVEDFIKKAILEITGDKRNVELYEVMFKKMNNDEFEDLLLRFRNNEDIPNVIIPHDNTNITVEKNLKLAKKYGIKMFNKIDMGPDGDEPVRRTKHDMLTYIIPFRRTKQTVEKATSVSMSGNKVDVITGQVTSDSRSSRISYTELQVLMGMGMTEVSTELSRDRGGDPGAMRVLKQGLAKYGKVSDSIVEEYREGKRSSQSLKNYFNGMHFNINIT